MTIQRVQILLYCLSSKADLDGCLMPFANINEQKGSEMHRLHSASLKLTEFSLVSDIITILVESYSGFKEMTRESIVMVEN